VLIDVPKDIVDPGNPASAMNWYWPTDEEVAAGLPGYRPTTKGHPRKIKEAAELILTAERPVIYAGGGILKARAADALRALAELTGIPVVTTLMARGAFPDDHELCLGMPGMHGNYTAVMSFQETDLLITLGARFDDRVTGRIDSFAPNAKIVQIDIDPASIRKTVQVHLPIVADAGEGMEKLLELIKEKDRSAWLEQIDQFKKKNPLPRPERDNLVPHEIMEAISQAVGETPIIASDVGLSQMWTANFFPFSAPRQYITSGGLGTMGYALPAALGAAVGNPGRTVLAINGDGAFQMNIQELATCSYYKIPVKTIILNNGTLGMVRQFQTVFLKKRYASTDLGSHVDFCAVARGFQVDAFKVTRKDELADTLKKAMAIDGPVVVDIDIDPDTYCFPMVPPGKKSVEAIFSPEDWEKT